MTASHPGADAAAARGRSGPMVRLAVSPIPAHVRTARLVAVAAAREFGAAGQLLEEIKLAVSEACTRAIAVTQRRDLVELSISLDGPGDDARITLVVRDSAPYGDADFEPGLGQGQANLVAGEDSPDASLLLTGMIEDVEIGSGHGGVGTVIRASWPTDASASS